DKKIGISPTVMLAKDRLIAKPLVYLGELATLYFKQQVSLWVAQQ
ncbi:MAG: hypothetical protein RJB11_2541, partial [Planctomycetota bacterium]